MLIKYTSFFIPCSTWIFTLKGAFIRVPLLAYSLLFVPYIFVKIFVRANT